MDVAKISVHVRNNMDIGFVEKNFTINILDTELIRYTLPSVSLKGLIKVVKRYGLVYNETSSGGIVDMNT